MNPRVAAIALLALGLLQMTGDVTGIAALKGIGAATAASPAPKVFSAVKGLETYSSVFGIEWTNRRGITQYMRLDSERYARLRGPYNRRNIYGAVLAYGPVLVSDPRTRPMFESVARYALCGEAPLLVELGIDPKEIRGHVIVTVHPLRGPGADGPSIDLEPPCR